MSETTMNSPDYPAHVLINLIINLLTPMFLAPAGGNIAFARQAAAETLESYRVESDADLISAALVIGFGLAALTALSQSMEDGLPVAATLRLRGNANACNRSAQQNRRALEQNRAEEPASSPEPPQPEFDEAEVIAAVAATRQRTHENLTQTAAKATPRFQEPTEQQYQAAWAAGIAMVAAEVAAEIPNLPPNQRAEATIQAAAMKDCANHLLAGDVPPRLHPGDIAAMMRPPGL
jgi:hypothetical protein